MQRRIVMPLLITLIGLMGCSKLATFSLKPISEVEFSVAEGLWHDVNLTNRSGRDLHEVRLTLTVIGEKGDPHSEERFFAQWPNGHTVKVSLSIWNSQSNVQKISLFGSSKEGRIESTWLSPPPRQDKPLSTPKPPETNPSPTSTPEPTKANP